MRRAWIASGAFALVYTFLAIVKYRSFHSGIDLGIFAQALASGHVALDDAVEGGSHFAFHFSPVLYLCVPLLLAAHSALALQIVQAVASALVAPAVYAIAARTLPEQTAFKLCVLALVYPPLAAVTFVDFHENGFVAPLVLWLAWSVLERRFVAAAGLAAALLSVKEDEALILAFAALVTALRARRAGDARLAGFGFATTGVALAVVAAYFAWLQPLAAGGRSWDPLRFYGAAGRGAASAVPYFGFARAGYVLEAAYPLLFLPFFSKRIVYALPGLLEDVASRQSLPFSMNSHYPAVWVPWMLFAAIDGCERVRTLAAGRLSGIATAALAVATCVLVFASPTHWRRYLSWPNAHDRLLQETLDRLPPRVHVATQDEIFSHLGFDPNAQAGSVRPDRKPALMLIDETRAGDSYFVPLLERDVGAPGSRYALESAVDGIFLYRATPPDGAPVSEGSGPATPSRP